MATRPSTTVNWGTEASGSVKGQPDYLTMKQLTVKCSNVLQSTIQDSKLVKKNASDVKKNEITFLVSWVWTKNIACYVITDCWTTLISGWGDLVGCWAPSFIQDLSSIRRELSVFGPQERTITSHCKQEGYLPFACSLWSNICCKVSRDCDDGMESWQTKTLKGDELRS